MTPRHCLLLIALLCEIFFVNAQSQGGKPNIIYIMTDDLGYADLSGYGRKDYQTPNLDKLARQGMKFMNAYAAAPLCTPTRVSFMTGRYAARAKLCSPAGPMPVQRAHSWTSTWG